MDLRIQESFDPGEYKVKCFEEAIQEAKQAEDLNQTLEKLNEINDGTRSQKTRSATYDELLALLDAEVRGLNEMQRKRESLRVETKLMELGYENVQVGYKTKTPEERLNLVMKSDSIPDALRLTEVSSTSDTEHPPQTLLLEQRPARVMNVYEKIPVAAIPKKALTNTDEITEKFHGVRHEIRHKRQVLEEVVLYDVRHVLMRN